MNSQENTSNSRVKNPQYGFQMVYYYSRCLGLWPFTITYNSKQSIQGAHVNLFDWFWFSISICLYLASAFCVYKNATSFLNAEFFYSNLILNISEVPSFLFGAIGIVLDMLNRNSLVNILKNFVIFDRRVGFEHDNGMYECKGQMIFI